MSDPRRRRRIVRTPVEPKPAPPSLAPDDDFWDEFADTSVSWVKLTEPGDAIAGTVEKISRFEFADSDRPSLELTIDGVSFTASTKLLLALLHGMRPAVGDHIAIELTDREPRQGGKTLNHYAVAITRPDGTVLQDKR